MSNDPGECLPRGQGSHRWLPKRYLGGCVVLVMGFIFVLAMTVVVAIGVTAYRQAWALPGGGPSQWGRTAAERYGAIPAAIAILVGGGILATVLSLPVGFLAKVLESPLDKPALAFALNHVQPASKLTSLNNKLTVFGNNGQIQLICLVAVILLAFAWRRNWWVPVALVVAVFYLERYSQRSLAKIVHRGHPPTSLGTFPSGGVGRILSVYGLLLILAITLIPALSRAWRVGLFTGLALAAVIEAYTRWYLAKHWLTDAVGAIVFGYLLLAVAATATAALASKFGPVATSASGDAGRPTVGKSGLHAAGRHASIPSPTTRR
jgi:membrane-associated phospholipid phosphatase